MREERVVRKGGLNGNDKKEGRGFTGKESEVNIHSSGQGWRYSKN